MTDLTPLLASSEDELELALLKSVDHDEPGADALPKAAIALGIGAALLTTTTSGAAGSAVAAGSALSKHASITLLSIVKWLAAGATAGLVASSSVHFAFRASTPTVAAPQAESQPQPANPGEVSHSQQPLTQAETTQTDPPAPVAADVIAPGAEPSPAVAAPRTAGAPPLVAEPPLVAGPPPHSVPSPPSPGQSSASFEPLSPHAGAPPLRAPSSTLADETRVLDHVRAELEARRPAAALAELNEFQKRWPTGALRAEAAVLRVEALLRSGDRAAAEREADALIRVAPHSRHAARVRELVSR